ncbi:MULTISPECIES: hypothetical protein [unclassified Corynebacterium]|nr:MULTISPECIES: hypothetical protein [unclassified Corynebacterium]
MGSVNSSAMLVGYVCGAPLVQCVGGGCALVLSGVGTVVFTVLPVGVTWIAKKIRRT